MCSSTRTHRSSVYSETTQIIPLVSVLLPFILRENHKWRGRQPPATSCEDKETEERRSWPQVGTATHTSATHNDRGSLLLLKEQGNWLPHFICLCLTGFGVDLIQQTSVCQRASGRVDVETSQDEDWSVHSRVYTSCPASCFSTGPAPRRNVPHVFLLVWTSRTRQPAAAPQTLTTGNVSNRVHIFRVHVWKQLLSDCLTRMKNVRNKKTLDGSFLRWWIRNTRSARLSSLSFFAKLQPFRDTNFNLWLPWRLGDLTAAVDESSFQRGLSNLSRQQLTLGDSTLRWWSWTGVLENVCLPPVVVLVWPRARRLPPPRSPSSRCRRSQLGRFSMNYLLVIAICVRAPVNQFCPESNLGLLREDRRLLVNRICARTKNQGYWVGGEGGEKIYSSSNDLYLPNLFPELSWGSVFYHHGFLIRFPL